MRRVRLSGNGSTPAGPDPRCGRLLPWTLVLLLPLGIACQLTSADQVVRPPGPRGTGGTVARDATAADEPVEDVPAVSTAPEVASVEDTVIEHLPDTRNPSEHDTVEGTTIDGAGSPSGVDGAPSQTKADLGVDLR